MAASQPLQVVGGRPKRGPRKEMSIAEAAAKGTRRDLLVAMRDRIASELDAGVPARELAACTRRLLEIAKDIEAIDAQESGDEVGEAAATPDEAWVAD